MSLSDRTEKMQVMNRLKSLWWGETDVGEGTDFCSAPEHSIEQMATLFVLYLFLPKH